MKSKAPLPARYLAFSALYTSRASSALERKHQRKERGRTKGGRREKREGRKKE